MRGLVGLVVALCVLPTVAACGASQRAHPYLGRLYSVGQVRRAFASLGLELHRETRRSPGLVFLSNDRRLGPEHLPSAPRAVTVVVATRRAKVGSSTRTPGRVTSYANVTAFSKRYYVDETRAAMSALRWGPLGETKPRRHLIVLGSSIGDVWLGESRQKVENALGMGRRRGHGVVSYPRQHLLVDYDFHDRIYPWVSYVETRWSGYHTRSGVHVGSTRQGLGPLYVSCASKTDCTLQAAAMPDAPGTFFTLRHDTIVEIAVSR